MPGKLRVALTWSIVPVFLLLARPTGRTVVAGFSVALIGLLLRAWAAGSIDKGAELATGGPYAHTRNPLYLGSFVIGVGIAIGGGHWAWIAGFALFFTGVYVPTIRQEAGELRGRFGTAFEDYAAQVPAFAVRLTPYRSGTRRDGFSLSRYLRYREWEAALGVAGLLLALALKARLAP